MRASVAAAVLEGVQGEAAVLEEVRAEARINDLLAEVTMTQRYRNPEDTNIEAIYTFPLPLDGVLLGFEVEIGDRKLAGVVVERAEAEHRYEDAITDGDAAVLLEQAEAGLYTASVGNLLPGESATIRFRYGLLLRWNGNRVRFMMPTTIAPRYGDPQAALAPHQAPEHVFDAERAFGLRVALHGLLKDARLSSPSHDVHVTEGPEETVVELAGAPVMDRDFVLEARLSHAQANGALLARDLDGWVVLASFRPGIPEGGRRERRSVKIVVDCSGSMGGDSIAQARAALERILDGLCDGDLFEIVAFGSDHRMLFGRETPVSETSLAKARRFVRTLGADMGGTEIGAALDAAYRVRGEQGLPRDLLLITDGEVWGGEEIIARARRSGHRIFTVGVGSAVAEPFVHGLAEATGGASELVAPREDMAERIHRHFQRMYAPRAVKADVRWPVEPRGAAPDPLGAVYGGDTVHVFGWFREKPEGAVALDVALAEGSVVNLCATLVPFEGDSDDTEGAALSTLARLGAARRLAAMEDGRAATELAVRYQLVSPWTSCIVVDVRAEAEKADDLPKIRKVPQIVAAGWHGMGTMHAAPCLDLDRDIAYSLRGASMKPSAPPARDQMKYRDLESAPAWVADAVAPGELVVLLNARGVPPFPTLNDLKAWSVPDTVMEALWELVDDGADETAVVVALLHALSKSEAGKTLDRQVRRRILKAYKALGPNAPSVDRMRAVLRPWCAFDMLSSHG